jgi:hypothetical protein
MNFLKALGLIILNFLLFLSISFFGLAFTLDQTFLNRDFTVSQVERLDTTTLAEDIIRDQVISQSTIPITLPIEHFITGAVHQTITDLEPWINQQARDVIYAIYDYIEGKSRNLSVVIEMETVKEQLENSISEAVITSLPPELAELPPDTIEGYLEPFYDWIPSSYEINEDLLGPDAMAQLDTLRQLVGYFNIVYYALIGFILLLILGIVLLKREVRGSTRSLGVVFLTSGVISYGGVWLARSAIGAQVAALTEVPEYLQSWLPQLINDFLYPMELYSYVLGGIGVVLLIVSFVYRRRAE